MSLARVSPPTRGQASFDAAIREYHKRTGYDILSSNAASKAGVSLADSPANIHAAFQSILTDVRRSQDGTLNTAIGKVLDGLLVFNEISGEIAAVTQVPGVKGIFVAFGIFLKTLKNYQDRKGELAALLTQVSDFLERFAVRESLDINNTWNHELYTRIFVNVLNVFALVTKILKGNKASKVLRGLGAAFLSNKDLKDASLLLNRDIDAEARWTCVEVLSAVNRVREDVSLNRITLDANTSTLSANTSTLNSNTIVLNSHTSALGDIQANVLECVGFVRIARTTHGVSRFGYPISAPSSTDLSHRRILPNDVDALVVARDAIMLFQRFTSTQITGEIRVPVACSVALALAMSPNLPILFRLALANMISFFMWNRVMMPRRVVFTFTLVTWASRVEMPLSAMRDLETYQSALREIFSDPNCPEHQASRLCSRQTVPFAWHRRDVHRDLSPGIELELITFEDLSVRADIECPDCQHPRRHRRPSNISFHEFAWYEQVSQGFI
ncbi:hypothetical protein CYLTODRAFT_412058 [Cylindrobasidium torrendii FP15055 ss-10]|uniref:Fungal STAND N-terminal Goodbye domain-containing protein n=1 Tax=Cylindrobasidium torrendii FP15055 ss-10 TaxID=1314674 RepID=A0A0D7B7C6_9AGAR|nr:hypothetical protein CYLTODRAFT_412058 [Cylindrobasidium torrendii FP15055 ss-10]